MKNLVLAIFVLLRSLIFSQNHLILQITESKYQGLESAEVYCSNQSYFSDQRGQVKIPSEQISFPARLVLSYPGFKTIDTTLKAKPYRMLSFQMEVLSQDLPELEIISGWVDDDEPFVHSIIGKEELKARNLGIDLPMLLESQPSVTTTSDAGNGIGYTTMRIRGTDLTRINISIDGIPLNEAESQLVFFVNLPDIMSSAQSIQVQRGVGPSSNGTGIFGATVNLVTEKYKPAPCLELSTSYGSFNSSRLSGAFSTGEIAKGLYLKGRISKIQSDGFVDRAFSDLESGNLFLTYKSAQSLTHFKVLYGREKTYQAWYGAPYQLVEEQGNRTFNPAGAIRNGEFYDNETDNYSQTHYHFVHSQRLTNSTDLSVKAFYTDGGGFFEQYIIDADPVLHQLGTESTTDLIRQLHLGTDYMGLLTSLETRLSDASSLEYGLSVTYYEGDHWGQVIWGQNLGNIDFPNEYYRNDAHKSDLMVFASYKKEWSPQWKTYADVQWRGVDYTYEGSDLDGSPIDRDVTFSFLNPKAGVIYQASRHAELYASFALAQKEPNRSDFISAAPGTSPRHETLYDIEIGGRWKSNRTQLGINAYGMYYDDQLILTGQLNEIGEYIRTNVDNSRRLGLEIEGTGYLNENISLSATATLSENRVLDFQEFIDDWSTGEQLVVDRSSAPLAFSPDLTAHASINYHCNWKKASFTSSLGLNHTGRQYLDFSGDKRRSLDPFTVIDLNAALSIDTKLFNEVVLKANVNNLLDLEYNANGWTYHFYSPEFNPIPEDAAAKSLGSGYYAQIGLFPQAGRNFMVGLDIRF